MKYKVLILKSNQESLNTLEKFLLQQGFSVHWTLSLKDAVEHLVKNPVDFFFVSADYQNNKIYELKTALVHCFSTTLVACAESNDKISLQALEKINFENSLILPFDEKSLKDFLNTEVKKKNQNFKFYNLTEEFKKLRASLTDQETLPLETKEFTRFSPEDKFLYNIFKGLKQSLDFLEPVKNIKEKVGLVSQLSCLSINKDKAGGHLLIGFSVQQEENINLTKQIYSNLSKFFSNQQANDQLHISKPVQIELKKIDFPKLAQKQAQFLVQAASQQNEILASFISDYENSIGLTSSHDENMLQLKLNEVQVNVPLEFDLYVFLPANGKFVLYSKKGRTIFADQKRRLIETGSAVVFVHKDEIEFVNKYRVQNYINAKVLESTI